MRVVLDTNVIVAAFGTRGSCAELFARVLAAHEYGVDMNLIGELPEVRVAMARDLLTGTGVLVEPGPLGVRACRDPDDDRILALARAFAADVLVTGDDDLLVLHPWSGIAIVRPRDFWPMDRAAAVRG